MKHRILSTLVLWLLCAATAVSQNVQYTYDGAGNRLARTRQTMTGAGLLSAAPARAAAAASGTIAPLAYIFPVNSFTLDEDRPVGSIPYTFQVNPNGSSEFTIPLTLPQGQAGTTPTISIRYNSLAGEGVLMA